MVWVGNKRFDSCTQAAIHLGADKLHVSRAAKYGEMVRGKRIRYAQESLMKSRDIPREFRCRCCDAPVLVDDPLDRRTVFCLPICNRRYWRHPERYRRGR